MLGSAVSATLPVTYRAWRLGNLARSMENQRHGHPQHAQTQNHAGHTTMDYQCAPDIDPTKDLTSSAVQLFQRFRQAADAETLSKLLDEETARHIKLCEMAILYYASCGYFWAPLPRHPMLDVNIWAFRHLEDMGFKIKHDTTGKEREVPNEYNRESTLKAIVVEHSSTANWLKWSESDSDRLDAEWLRREALEEEDRSRNPPTQLSVVVDGTIKETTAAWAAVVEDAYVVEVRRIHGPKFLCIFDIATGRCIHQEKTNVAFGATFGPDAGDVAMWQDRAMEIVRAQKPDSPAV